MTGPAWIIVGGGAAGLSAAYFLRKNGFRSIIVEREPAVGGRMGAVSLGPHRLDCGGKNIGKKYRLFREFASSLGHDQFEHFGLSSSQVIDGRIVTFDARARWKSFAEITRDLSAKDVRRFGHILWRVMSDEALGYLQTALSSKLADRFDDHPASHYFSPGFARRVLRPMSIRMNGAEPDEIYLGNLTSNVGMIVDTYEQIASGLTPLFSQVHAQYDVLAGSAVESLVMENGRCAGVRLRTAAGELRELRGAGVVLATPASASAALADRVAPELARKLREVAYFPVMIILAQYDRPVFSPTVRALAFGDEEIVSNAGAYGANALNVVRYTFSGRAVRPGLAQGDGEALLYEAETILARHIPVEAQWRVHHAVRSFDPGLCAYVPHHGRWVSGIREDLRSLPGLYLTGDYLRGASIEACFRASLDCVGQLVAEVGEVPNEGSQCVQAS